MGSIYTIGIYEAHIRVVADVIRNKYYNRVRWKRIGFNKPLTLSLL